MGLLDFFRKGVEKPVESKPAASQPYSPTQGRPTNTPKPSVERREYVIKSGDSLSKIAKQFYGNAADWPKIHNANKDVIKDPNLIYPGQKIVIP